MAEGMIAALRRDGGSIRPDEGDAELSFDAAAVEGAEFDELHPGQRVTYAPEEDPRGPGRRRATAVRPAEAVAGD